MKDRRKQFSAPFLVSLMVTSRCNLRCLHCSAPKEQFRGEDMTTREILGVINQLAAYQVFRLVLTGGEPLLQPDFFTVLQAALDCRMRVQVNTNATLVTANVADRFKRLPGSPLISVSLDGVSPETHDYIRGPDSLSRVKSGLQALVNAGLKVRPLVVVSQLNHHELGQIHELARNLGVRQLMLSVPVACGRACLHEQELTIGPNACREAFETVLALDDRDPGFLVGTFYELACTYDVMKRGSLRRLKENPDGQFLNCGAARNQAAIAADGTVSPCELALTYRAGNVKDRPFAEIWHHSPVFEAIREATRKRALRDVPGCEDCSWRHLCAGPCPATAFSKSKRWPAAEESFPCIRNVARMAGFDSVMRDSTSEMAQCKQRN